MNPFGLGDALFVSVFSMLIVFFILILLTVIISLLKYIPGGKEEAPKKPAKKAPAAAKTSAKPTLDGRMIAMLTASCVAQERAQGDVRVLSCREL